MATLIKVSGASRTGTTMLDLMLGNAPDAFSCGEVHALFRPLKKPHFKIECRCGQNPCPVWEKIKHVPEHQFHATIFKELGVKFVIDSSKKPYWLIDTQRWAIASGIKVFNLVLWKDPIHLAYSHWKRGGGTSGWRRGFVNFYSRFFDTGLPFRTICLDDMVSNPQEKLADICAAVGMTYFEGKEKFWEKDHHYLLGNYGIYEQTRAKHSTIRASATYPPEFEAHINAISQQIAQDSQVRRILETLQNADISTSNAFSNQELEYVPRRPYPMWYYTMRAQQKLRRFFPG